MDDVDQAEYCQEPDKGKRYISYFCPLAVWLILKPLVLRKDYEQDPDSCEYQNGVFYIVIEAEV